MRRFLAILGLVTVSVAPAVSRAEDGPVVVYAALDREFSEPVLKDLAKREGLTLRPKYDVESTKTVGLVNAIMAESVNPRCDLFWNNEILNTIRLKRKGLLAPFRPKAAADLPPTFRDPDGLWYGFAARARILIVNTNLVAEADRPAGLADLASPRWKGKVGVAKPLFGTTATHAACLFAAWGWLALYAIARPERRAWVELLALAALAFGLLPLLNALTTDRHLGVTLPAGDGGLAGVDLTMLALAAMFAAMALRLQRRWQGAA